MTVARSVHSLHRTVVEAYLLTGQLSLTVVQRLAGQHHNTQWAPAVVYETFEAKVEATLGVIVRDKRLIERGRIRTEKVAQLRHPDSLGLVATNELAAKRRPAAAAT